ncbi:F0F1 ATP synthase subunit epsilon [Holospora obtusa F1]|uniref:F0F1 ATP synthase subunit epsilon n=1 Tax=Holospora obtusa F1 TaxID=1399147 RepID=W6TCZ0_HOLOB|nr:hypothetical protein [Holospora obtusa]ETZ06688.1 F0F1 ATP synthase subunit epsilon [Holospora obtusa F1]
MHNHSDERSFRVTLKHINQTVYSGNVFRILVPTSCGCLEISPGHCTLFQVISSGWIEVWAVEEPTSLKFLCSSGVLEVLHDQVTLNAFQLVESHQRQQVEYLLKILNLPHYEH